MTKNWFMEIKTNVHITTIFLIKEVKPTKRSRVNNSSGLHWLQVKPD